MNEQSLANSTDTPSISNTIKELNPIENHDVSSFIIRRSLSNKLDVLAVISPPTPTSSTESITQSIIMIPTDDVKNSAFFNDSDNDSFDDEDEIITSDSVYSSLSPTSSNYGLKICPICFEFSTLQSSSCCKFRCCNTCWCAHISSTINDGRIKISCVSNECNKYLSREIIVNFIRYDSILHERYLKLYANINQNPRAKTCPRCSHLYSLDTNKLIELKDSKKLNKKIPKQIQCSECSLVWCFRCSAPWHENLTCKQFIKGDKLLLKWINQKNEDQWNARKCPKCSSVIQRNGGCPHMTCSSCSCEFCYLCGRRYIKIPIIGQHNNKFSMLGCPYNLHPERPWLRRTIRGVIATGIVVASPLIVAGAVTAAVTVLPSIGLYKLVRHVRARRRLNDERLYFPLEPGLLGLDREQQQELFGFDLHNENVDLEERLRALRNSQPTINIQTNDDENILLSIFADMDVENLFLDDERPTSGFRTCPTTPAIIVKNDHSQSSNNLTIN